MDARDVMNSNVVTVPTDCPTRKIARLLVENSISAVPVIDAAGKVVGMVSEGDLLRFGGKDQQSRRDWWLAMLAEGNMLSQDFLQQAMDADLKAEAVMTAPIIAVQESTPIDEIAQLLASHKIKRVPVLRDGSLVGIVSRADLLKALAQTRQPGHAGLLGFMHIGGSVEPKKDKNPAFESGPAASADDFSRLVDQFEQSKNQQIEFARREANLHRQAEVETLLTHHLSDSSWEEILRRARAAAAQGERECLLLRFPSELCSDGGRAINAPEPNWPQSLRGEPAELFRRWDLELRPKGFGMIARILTFPGGFPGDVGLFLSWGGPQKH
jgi:CBS domain-containing protein